MYVSMDGDGESCGDCDASRKRKAQSDGDATKAKHDAIDAISAGQSLAKETGGLRIVVVALAGFVSARMVE